MNSPQFEFETKIEGGNVAIWNYLPNQQMGSDYDIEGADFVVCWDCSITARNWGIDDISWSVAEIHGTFDVVHYNIKGDEYDRKTIEFDFAPFKEGTVMGTEISNYSSLAPDGIDIDWVGKTITVT